MDDDQRIGLGGDGLSCNPANFYSSSRLRPKNEEGILVSPLSSGDGDGGGGDGKRKLKSSRRPLSLPLCLRPQFPFMGELFSYLNVAETAAAAEATGGSGGGEDELLHGGNIIEARGTTTEASSSLSLARAPGVSHYPFAFP